MEIWLVFLYIDQLLGKDPEAGKDWRQKEKREAEDEVVRWHHWLNGHEFEHLLDTVKDREAWHAAVHGVTKSWTQLATEQQQYWPISSNFANSNNFSDFYVCSHI